MTLFLVAAAFASAPDRFPLRADVALPEAGPVRVHVPLGLRSAADPPDGSDLLLVDATGRPEPFARIEGHPTARDAARVTVVAAEDPEVYTLDLGPLPVDELTVDLPAGVPSATVTVRRADGAILSGPTVVFDLPDGSHLDVALPPTAGRIEVSVHPPTPASGSPSFLAWRRRAPGLAPERVDVVPAAPVLQENGFVRYGITLERPLPIDRATVIAAEPVFERQASLLALPWQSSPEVAFDVWPQVTGNIRRVAVLDTVADLTTIPGPETPSDRLALLISADGLPPLDVERVTLEVQGVHLLVLEPGPGPHTLYGGAPPGTSAGWDLQAASPELARAATVAVQPGPVVANPEWQPPEVRANLAGPGPELELDRWRWQRPVQGEGLVRVRLPAEVLASARPDLGDLRLVVGDRQVSYVLQRRLDEPVVEGTTFERLERGSRSVLRVQLPEEGLPIASLTLSTPAEVFERQVTVSQVRAASLEPLRTVSWVGRDRPVALRIGMSMPIGDELVVEIENGDDPPLPIEALTVRATGWELVTVLPVGGATLLYGAPGQAAPEYDLSLLASELAERAAAEATLGDRAEVAPPALGAGDRVLLGIGVGVLALGLLALAAELLRRVPEAPPSG